MYADITDDGMVEHPSFKRLAHRDGTVRSVPGPGPERIDACSGLTEHLIAAPYLFHASVISVNGHRPAAMASEAALVGVAAVTAVMTLQVPAALVLTLADLVGVALNLVLNGLSFVERHYLGEDRCFAHQSFTRSAVIFPSRFGPVEVRLRSVVPLTRRTMETAPRSCLSQQLPACPQQRDTG
jgi:hypothetical protein